MWIRCFQALPSHPAQARGALCRFPLQSPLGLLAKLGRLMFPCAAAVCQGPGQGLLGSPMFLRHMLRLTLAGCKICVSHRHVLG